MNKEEQMLEKIENMSYEEMEWFYRNASANHPFLKNDRVGHAFQTRLEKLKSLSKN